MIPLEASKTALILHIHGVASTAFALRGTLTVPLAHIKAVRPRPAEIRDFGLQLWGVGTGEWARGYFYLPNRGLVFADRSSGHRVIAIDLDHERYVHLYIEVEGKDAEEAARFVDEARKCP